MYRLDGEGFHSIPLLMNYLLNSNKNVTRRTDIVLKRPIPRVTLNSQQQYFSFCLDWLVDWLVSWFTCVLVWEILLWLNSDIQLLAKMFFLSVTYFDTSALRNNMSFSKTLFLQGSCLVRSQLWHIALHPVTGWGWKTLVNLVSYYIIPSDSVVLWVLSCLIFKDKWCLEHDDVILGQSIGRVSTQINMGSLSAMSFKDASGCLE